jgi:hypothetical protein
MFVSSTNLLTIVLLILSYIRSSFIKNRNRIGNKGDPYRIPIEARNSVNVNLLKDKVVYLS